MQVGRITILKICSFTENPMSVLVLNSALYKSLSHILVV